MNLTHNKKIRLASTIAIVLIVGWLLLLNHQHEVQKKQHAEVVTALARLKQEFIVGYLAQGEFPRNNKEANLPPPEQLTIGPIKELVVMRDSRVFMTLQFEDGPQSTLFLTPEMNSNDQFSWFCRSPKLSEELKSTLFKGCHVSTENLSLAQASALQYVPRRKSRTPEPEKLDIKLPPAPPKQEPTAELAVKPCEDTDSKQLLVHDDGIGIWDFTGEPTLSEFIPLNINRPQGIAARIGSTLFVAQNSYIWYADTKQKPITLQKSSVWIKPGTQLFSTGRQLIWITPDNLMFVGDVCYPPNIRIIHDTNLRLSGNRKVVNLTIAEGQLHVLSRYESDWSDSSTLNIYRLKENGALVHQFNFNFRGNANSMYRSEPYLLIANGRDGLSIKQRTSDHRWMETESISASDFIMDAVLKKNSLWVADRSAGLIVYRRRSEKAPWEQVDQKEFDFPAFHLQWFEHGIRVSSATRHAWVPHQAPQTPRILQPAISPGSG